MAPFLGELMTRSNARCLLQGSPEQAVAAGADGVHLPARVLRKHSQRPLSRDHLVAASCNDESDLARAGRLALDFVTIGPVRSETQRSEPDSPAVSWRGFEGLCRLSPLPVYALGDLGPADLARVRERGGFGVASDRAAGGSA
jgi:8-oxo-dGTP diphosphatase